MRVLFLVHDFLPNHPAGTELYTGGVAKALAARGHEVRVFTTEKDIAREHLALERRTWEGLPVHELVQNLFYADFRQTWDYPPAAAAFGRVLDEFRPEVVHAMHLLYLSVGCLEEARLRGIPVVFTLHDFWLSCARFGQRLHPDGGLCETVDFARCGTCLAQFKFAQSPLERRVAGVVAGVKGATGLDLSRPLRLAGDRLRGRAREEAAGVPAEAARRFEALARERDGELCRRVVAAVARFFAPSDFLGERMIAWGLPAEKVERLDYGLDLAPFRAFARTPVERLRVTFIGTLAPHKGAHVLLAALEELPSATRARLEVTLHGPKTHHPEYVAELERRAAPLGVQLPGTLARTDLAAALGATDLLVVPSVWYENSPFTIHEARATKTPLLVSDLGGMRELVEEGRHGWRFPPGDARALSAHLARLALDRAPLAALDFPGRIKDFAESALELEQRYLALGRRA
jgi:glycosyltransferase involved in cell wall biosynthesis